MWCIFDRVCVYVDDMYIYMYVYTTSVYIVLYIHHNMTP